MRRKYPLKWTLTAAVMSIWLLIVIIFMSVYNIFISKIDNLFLESIIKQTKETQKALVQAVEFELAVKDNAGMKEKVSDFDKKDKDIVLIAVLTPDKKVILRSSTNKHLNPLLKTARTLGQDDHRVKGDFLVAQGPVLTEEKAI